MIDLHSAQTMSALSCLFFSLAFSTSKMSGQLVRVLRKELIGTLRQRRPDLDNLAAVRHTEGAVATLAHALPQVGEEIGEQRQRAGLTLH